MSGLRPPVFGGVAAGVGTTTLARALHGVDGGLAVDGRTAGGTAADVLVCRVDSLARVAGLTCPVLAVVADRPPRLDRITGRFGTVVTVPDIAAWHGLDAPEVAGVLALAPNRRPARLQAFIDALLAVTAAALRSGVLVRPDATGRGPHPGTAPASAGTGRAGWTAAGRGARPPAVPSRPGVVPARPSPGLLPPAAPIRAVPAPARPGTPPARAARPAVPAPVVPPLAPAPGVPGPDVLAQRVPTQDIAVPAAPASRAPGSGVPVLGVPMPSSPPMTAPASRAPAPGVPASGVPVPISASAAAPAPGIPAPAGPVPVAAPGSSPLPVGPAPVAAAPAGRPLVVPVPVVPVPLPDGALWRGLRAVERAPVPLRIAPPAPVPLHRSTASAPAPVHGRPLRLRPDTLDDDALESMRAG